MMRRTLAAVGFVVIPLFGYCGNTAADQPDSVLVFAAASTTNAVTDIGELFAARKMGKVIHSFASSSTLAKQIENGAPANVYISANKKWMDYLEENRLIVPSSRFNLLSNRIVLIAPSNSRAAIVTGNGTAVAKRFLDFLKTAAAQAVFEKYGFKVR